MSLQGNTVGCLGPAPGHRAGSAAPRAPCPALLSFFPHSPAQPHGSSSYSQKLRGLLRKRAVPHSKSQPMPAMGRLYAGREAPHPWRDQGAKRGKHDKTMPGVPGSSPPPCTSPEEIPPTWSLPTPMPEAHVLWHCSVPAGTESCPRQASHWDSHRAQRTPVSPEMLVLTSIPFSFFPWGSKALCSPCAPGGSSPWSSCSAQAQGSRPGAGGQQLPGLLLCSPPAARRSAG